MHAQLKGQWALESMTQCTVPQEERGKGRRERRRGEGTGEEEEEEGEERSLSFASIKSWEKEKEGGGRKVGGEGREGETGAPDMGDGPVAASACLESLCHKFASQGCQHPSSPGTEVLPPEDPDAATST